MRITLNHFLLLITIIFFILEFLHSWKEKKDLYKAKETKTSLMIGMGSFVSSFISRMVILGAFELGYQFRFFTLDHEWWIWVAALVGSDLSYYCYHRTAHHVSWFWASHVVHHSSSDYNLSTAFRTSWTGQLSGQFLFWTWMPLLGFDPFTAILAFDLCHFYQFWLHTETVKKLPAIVEFIFNTPSHHRVHHGSDLKYLDKNHGGILIIWDRLFNTFKCEDERPRYGLTKNMRTSNPFHIVFTEWIDLFLKIFSSGSTGNAINYFLKPPGWSHDGTSKTAKEMIAEYNRLHPDASV